MKFVLFLIVLMVISGVITGRAVADPRKRRAFLWIVPALLYLALVMWRYKNPSLDFNLRHLHADPGQLLGYAMGSVLGYWCAGAAGFVLAVMFSGKKKVENSENKD